jgi:hypothetical protein
MLTDDNQKYCAALNCNRQCGADDRPIQTTGIEKEAGHHNHLGSEEIWSSAVCASQEHESNVYARWISAQLGGSLQPLVVKDFQDAGIYQIGDRCSAGEAFRLL